MKQQLLIRILIVLLVLGTASGWAYHFWGDRNVSGMPQQAMSQNELMALQISFIKQYGTQATITEAIVPKIYEVAWTDGQGVKNVSINVGGVWVLIASVSSSPPTSPPTTTPPAGGK